MDPHSFIARAEAQRWIGIAEKLLMSHDLVGSKTFAIRARESDPRLQSANQILAIIDTLIAAEKQIITNNNTQQPDYYAILQVNQFVQDVQHITNQYQRLGMLLNPSENRFPYSEQAFELVNDAWAVLSNPMRKSIYDSELNHYLPHQHHQEISSIGFHNQQQQQQQQQHYQHQQPQQHFHHQQHQFNFFANNNEHELAEPNYSFQARLQRQLQQHNFLFNSNSNANSNANSNVNVSSNSNVNVSSNSSGLGGVVNERVSVDSNAARLGGVGPEQQQHVRVQEQMFQANVQPFQFTYIPPPPQSQPVPQQEPQVFWQQQPVPQPQPESEPLEQNANEVNANDGVNEEEIQTEGLAENVEAEGPTENVDGSPTFWTACPYCLHMFEYPRVYVDCVLCCDHCKRASQAVSVPCPPIIEGKEAYFCCWGYFPVGVSMSHLEKNSGKDAEVDWKPVSTLNDVSSQVKEHLNAIERRKLFEKPIYFDDVTDDIFEGISETESSDESDVDWGSTRKKKAKRTKRDMMKANVLMGRNGKSVENSIPVQNDVGAPTGPSNPRRQSGRFAKGLNKLDLNVEFNNNEGEEGARRAAGGTHGHGLGEEDIIEGNGFFEGLDEFLDNLPILEVGNDEAVEAA